VNQHNSSEDEAHAKVKFVIGAVSHMDM